MENSTQNQPIERLRTIKKIVCKYRVYPPDFEAWKLLWKLNFLCPRVLMFIWRLLTNSLHTRENIHKCIQHFNPYCSLRKEHIGTLDHLFLYYLRNEEVFD
ncbi:60S ribosomal protein L6-like [Iris pallida]|uniref:60S ribosomal protein L6-like n=1 Tax=Iris pallida TaxID=29817 RepID=A0AAX6E709_IRIPA|nr:60S ribosomal protein L6-like [Iris pallida]